MAKSQKRKKIIITSVLATLVSLAGLIALITWLGWSGSTKDIESVANQFKPDSSWKLVSSHADPPRTLCMAQVCPQLDRTWTTPEPLTQDELIATVRRSGWNNVEVEAGCKPENTKSHVCPLRGTVEKYNVVIVVDDNDYLYKAPSVGLSLE